MAFDVSLYNTQNCGFWCFVQHVADGLEGVNNGQCHSVWNWANNDCIRVVVICSKYIFVASIGEV